eukprot:SAG31_NODE_10825_length_1093_cov_1.073441_1_plen_82_part_10
MLLCRLIQILPVSSIVPGMMGLIESEWLATLATIDADEVIYTDYVECAHELYKELKAAGCDMVIALTHSRVPNDERLAQVNS